MFDWEFFVKVFVTLFVIIDPPGIIPLFLSLTNGRSQRTRRRLAWQAVAVSFGVIVAFALFGEGLLRHLGISVPALQASGGLLLLLVALELLTGKFEEPSQVKEVSVALVPLGTPLLAGPGSIVATIVFVRQVSDLGRMVALAAGILAVHLALWVTMRYSLVIIRFLKESGVTLISRIAGLLLSAIAVQMVADAVRSFISAN